MYVAQNLYFIVVTLIFSFMYHVSLAHFLCVVLPVKFNDYVRFPHTEHGYYIHFCTCCTYVKTVLNISFDQNVVISLTLVHMYCKLKVNKCSYNLHVDCTCCFS